MGLRTLALEEDWTKALQPDEYVRTGDGDPRTLLADAGPPWQTQEVVDLLWWAQSYNQRHSEDPVRFVGVDVVAVRSLAYDAVADFVRQHRVLAALRHRIRPSNAKSVRQIDRAWICVTVLTIDGSFGDGMKERSAALA